MKAYVVIVNNNGKMFLTPIAYLDKKSADKKKESLEKKYKEVILFEVLLEGNFDINAFVMSLEVE